MSSFDQDQLTAFIEAEIPSLIAIRHSLHENPGIMYQETYAARVVQDELRSADIEFRAGLAGGTGVLAHLPGKALAAIGLRADMDALPIQEETGYAHASKIPGVMHACGHDGHTTILIGAARVLKRISNLIPLPRPVTFVFQPAEEGGAGGARMIEDGCLDGTVLGPRIAQMFALHGWPDLDVGKMLTREGAITAATAEFKITVEGQGGHAAFPHFGHDPIVAAAAVVMALQTIVARNVDPLLSAVVSVTMFHGGTAFNVIPGQVYLQGTLRALDTTVMRLIKERVTSIAEQVATAHGCQAAVNHTALDYPVTINGKEAIDMLRTSVPEIDTTMPPVMGGEDFAYYSQVVPSGFFMLGLRLGPEKMPGLHHPKFDFTDEAIRVGISAFCRLALRD